VSADPHASGLLARFFQHAYVTNDMERAKAQFADRWGVRSFLQFDSSLQLQTPRGLESAQLRIALAFVGDLQIELIEPLGGGGAQLYRQALPPGGYRLTWHHFAYRLPAGQDAWRSFRSRVGTADYPLAIEGHLSGEHGEVRFVYLDTYAELGHYSEYVWATYDIDAAVPRN
jgi:hypothetical protein